RTTEPWRHRNKGINSTVPKTWAYKPRTGMVTSFAVALLLNYFLTASSTTQRSTRLHDPKVLELFSEALNETSFACRVTLRHCQYQFPDADDRYRQKNLCGYMRVTRDNVTFHDCVVSAGFCTVNEFNNLTNIACQERNSTFLELSEGTSTFYKALYTTSADCVVHLLACIDSYVIALIYKTQESYCHLMDIKFDHYFCYRSSVSCSEEEIELLTHRACMMQLADYEDEMTTNSAEREELHFSDTLSFCSNSCRWSFHECVRTDARFLLPFLFSQRYCDLVGVIALKDQTFKECLVDNGLCSPKEYSEMYDQACARATIVGVSLNYLPLLNMYLLYNFI
ncbi:unnamed protein product, partial [Lymnaea stagnalis]